MRYSKLALMALCTLLFACAPVVPSPKATPLPQPTNPEATSQPLSTIPPGTTSPSATSVPLADDVLAIYHKTGGIAGIDETLTVHQGGLLELVQKGGNSKSVQLDEPMIQPVRRMLEQKDFGEVAPMYQAVGADLFTYTLTARDASGNAKTVTTMDGANPPAFLGQLVAMFEQLRAAVR